LDEEMTRIVTADELDRLSREVIPKPVRSLALCAYVGCVVLDVIALFGLQSPAPAVARFACAIRPFGVISAPLFADELLRFSAKQCAEIAHEPAISIVFLSVKLALGMLLVPVVCYAVLLRPQGMTALCEAFRDHAVDRAAYLRELKRWGKRFLVLIPFDIICILLTSQSNLSEFNTSFAHKLFLEDGAAIVVPATLFAAIIVLVMLGTTRPPPQSNLQTRK
jgi:hypothetical protein